MLEKLFSISGFAIALTLTFIMLSLAIFSVTHGETFLMVLALVKAATWGALAIILKLSSRTSQS